VYPQGYEYKFPGCVTRRLYLHVERWCLYSHVLALNRPYVYCDQLQFIMIRAISERVCTKLRIATLFQSMYCIQAYLKILQPYAMQLLNYNNAKFNIWSCLWIPLLITLMCILYKSMRKVWYISWLKRGSRVYYQS
jgi:hypothetical protein